MGEAFTRNAAATAAATIQATFHRSVSLTVLCSMKMISGMLARRENRKRMSSIFHSFDKMWHIIHHKMMMMMMMRLKFLFKAKEWQRMNAEKKEKEREEGGIRGWICEHRINSEWCGCVFGRLTF